MRLYSIALLAATVLHACISAATTSKLTVADYPAVIHLLADNQIGGPPTRMLRTYETTDEGGEERAGNVLDKVVGAAKSGIASTKIKYWSSKDQTPADVLKMLKLGDDAAAALENPKLKALTKLRLLGAARLEAGVFFTKYASHFKEKFPDNKISLIRLLTKRFGDIDVTMQLASAKANQEMMGVIAKQLWTEQQSVWLNSGKSVDNVFTLLKIRNDEYWGDTAKKLNALDDYVRLHNGGKSGGDTLVNAVSRGFGGEGEWARAIQALAKRQDKLANKSGSSKANAVIFGQFTAKKMQTALFEHWWNQNLQPANVVVKLSKDEKGNLFPKDLQMSGQPIITEYKAFYRTKMEIFPTEVHPRRS